MRRLRMHPVVRDLVTETRVGVENLIAPIFVVPGKGVRTEISSLKGQFHFSSENAASHAANLSELGINAVILFGIPNEKDDTGKNACSSDGVIQRAISAIKTSAPKTLVITDLCFCEYTAHGHCGIMKNGVLDNDLTLPMLAEQAISHAIAGADMIAPSGMIDGAVAAIRSALDQGGFKDTPIMSYAAKYASAFYGPFRDAVQSAPSFGDRRSHQMNPANSDEAMREVALDIEEGADIVMVKPALPYLDVIYRVRSTFNVPVAAYNVSGEYAMVKTAAAQGLIDENLVVQELLTSIKRAGADLIITYFAEQFARAISLRSLSR